MVLRIIDRRRAAALLASQKPAAKKAPPRKGKLRLQSEAELQRQCLTWLSLAGVWHLRLNAGGGLRDWGGGRLAPVKGAPAGTPDLLCAGNGVTVFVELKAEGGRLRPSQEAWAKSAEAAGLCVLVIRSLQGLQDALRDEGVIS